MKEVILGLPGPWADDYLEIADHYTTKIGGYPDWPFPESLLGSDFLDCCSCKSKLCLISQVYAPIHESALKIEERVIYVFGCLNSPCGSWRAIRVQKPGDCGETELVDSEAGPSIVSSSASEIVDSDDDLSMEELSRALFEAASLAAKKTKQKSKRKTKNNSKALSLKPDSRKVDSITTVLPCFYLYSQEDKSSQDPSVDSLNNPSLSVKEAQVYKDNTDPIQEETWDEEGYEYDRALNADRIYLKFKKRLDKCPEQCFRYSFGGKPLLAIGDVTDPTTCDLCGEPRHYELQFMSPLVYFLQEGATGGQKDLLDNWNWMTLIVYTCSKSCNKRVDSDLLNRNGWTVAEEIVIAQFEKPLTESHLAELAEL